MRQNGLDMLIDNECCRKIEDEQNDTHDRCEEDTHHKDVNVTVYMSTTSCLECSIRMTDSIVRCRRAVHL